MLTSGANTGDCARATQIHPRKQIATVSGGKSLVRRQRRKVDVFIGCVSSGTNKRITVVLDDRFYIEEIVEHGFGGAIGSFYPGLVVGVRFSDDENICVRAFD